MDLCYEIAGRLLAVEIKAGATLSASHLTNLERQERLLPRRLGGKILVHDGQEELEFKGTRVTNPAGFAGVIRQLELTFMTGSS